VRRTLNLALLPQRVQDVLEDVLAESMSQFQQDVSQSQYESAAKYNRSYIPVTNPYSNSPQYFQFPISDGSNTD